MKTLQIKIGGRPVGDGYPCLVIAEIGSNHNHEFDRAIAMIDAAVDAGADAVKFQTFRADEHYSRKTPGFKYLDDADTHALIKSLEIDRSWHRPLKEHAESRGVVFFSSPCDSEAIQELAALDTAAYKIASFDLPDLGLIKEMAEIGKPVLLSTGMADWGDIERAVAACRSVDNDQVVLLQCTSLYPAPESLSNLAAMAAMRERFGVIAGYSDHTLGDEVALASVALGSAVIEKHFTLDRSLPGPDHAFAIEPHELANMVERIRHVESALGDGDKSGPRPEEQDMFEKGRRSLHARVAISRGQKITDDMLVVKRPGLGIPPFEQDGVVGRTAKADIEEDQWITWDMI